MACAVRSKYQRPGRDHAALVQNPAGTLRRAATSPARALSTHVTGHLGTAVSNFSGTATELDQRRRQNRFIRVVPVSNGASHPRRRASGYAPCSTATQKFDRSHQRAGHRAGHAGPPNRRKHGACFRQRSTPTRVTVNPARHPLVDRYRIWQGGGYAGRMLSATKSTSAESHGGGRSRRRGNQ